MFHSQETGSLSQQDLAPFFTLINNFIALSCQIGEEIAHDGAILSDLFDGILKEFTERIDQHYR